MKQRINNIFFNSSYSITEVSLAQMLFERKLKIKLQKLSKNIIYLLIRKVTENDTWKKIKEKNHFDRYFENKTNGKKLDSEDKVLIKKTKENKLTTNFNSKKFILNLQ